MNFNETCDIFGKLVLDNDGNNVFNKTMSLIQDGKPNNAINYIKRLTGCDSDDIAKQVMIKYTLYSEKQIEEIRIEKENRFISQIKAVSSDPSFVDAMIKLHNEDPIEFQIKMSQLKGNRINTQSNSNTPHCTVCGSSNLTKISTLSKATNAAMFGLLGNKRKCQWHCNSCGTNF
jgi:hypothetical protein